MPRNQSGRGQRSGPPHDRPKSETRAEDRVEDRRYLQGEYREAPDEESRRGQQVEGPVQSGPGAHGGRSRQRGQRDNAPGHEHQGTHKGRNG
ncbi:MAG TPA: hypothetical protein VEB22_12550 [Phycisphaerales bacterium]|nr:hypothetical protein [Phycisphaerales bacterium]